jgi:hypothetical protein
MFSHHRVLKLWPENPRHIQKLHAVAQLDPLFASGDSGAILHLGALGGGHPVDKGGFTHIGHSYHHHPQGPPHHSLGAAAGQLFQKQLFHRRDKTPHSFAAAAVHRQSGDLLLFKMLQPRFGGSRVGHIAFVEDDDALFAPQQLLNFRVGAGIGNSGIPQFRNQIHQPQIFPYHSAGFCHVAGKPLNMQVFPRPVELPAGSVGRPVGLPAGPAKLPAISFLQ